MGYGGYSYEAHEAITRERNNLPLQEVFKQTRCHSLMNPHGVRFRESRDSPAHPNSVGIVFALDVTGSMGAIPDLLARRELPTFMKTLMDCGLPDPQVLFMAIGDAESDGAPLQVGQFESAAKEMDQWLTWSYLEGGGGPLGRESYELGLYFAARHTQMDCLTKRGHKGYLLMTGDEDPYMRVSRKQVQALCGDDLHDDVPVQRVVAEVQKSFQPFFLIPDKDRRKRCERTWRDLLGDHVVCMEDPVDTCHVSAGIIALTEGALADLDALAVRVSAAGASRERVAAVVRALTPYAATLGRDGAPAPALTDAPLPASDGPGGHRR